MKVILKRDGLYTSDYDHEKKKRVVEKLDTSTHRFLRAWHCPIEIRGKVRLKDLLQYLKTFDPLVLDLVAKLTRSNIEGYLKEDLTPRRDPDRKSKLKSIEVYKYYELSNYTDPDDVYELEDNCVSAHGIGEPWEEGCEDVPLEQRGNSYAIEFTPWCYLMNLPLSLKERTAINKVKWAKTKPRKAGFKKKGSKKFEVSWVQDRRSLGFENTDVKVTYTLGEFFCGLFDELCFFWTPAKRDEKERKLLDRFQEVKEAGSDDFSEYVEE